MKVCTICQQAAGVGSWVDNRWTCSSCYKLAVAQVLAARRKPLPTPGLTLPMDRTPMPATADVTEGDSYFRVPSHMREKPPLASRRRKPHCSGCGGELPRRNRDRLHMDDGVFCTITCWQASSSRA